MKFDIKSLAKQEPIVILIEEFKGSFDGRVKNNSYHPKGRMGARLSAYKDGKLVYQTSNASTMPDSATDKYGNLYNGGDPIPCIKEGIYTVSTKIHRGSNALEVKSIEGWQDVPVIRSDKDSTSKGINMHFRNKNDVGGYAFSTGCITVLKKDLADMFTALGITTFGGQYVGKLVIDRSSITKETYNHYKKYWYPNSIGNFATLEEIVKMEVELSDWNAILKYSEIDTITDWVKYTDSSAELANLDLDIGFLEMGKYLPELYRKIFEAGIKYGRQ